MSKHQKLLVGGFALAAVAFVLRFLIVEVWFGTSWNPPALLFALTNLGLWLLALVGVVVFLVGLILTATDAVRHRERARR